MKLKITKSTHGTVNLELTPNANTKPIKITLGPSEFESAMRLLAMAKQASTLSLEVELS